ncbi:MAG: cytochrome c oxidase subunit I [Planctomycetes bacterium]|nr:cytochrome c oxidase subunit I [Planctomycetota bacterium]
MSTVEAAVPGAEPRSYLQEGRGIRSWIFTLDHKRIGVLYLVSVMASFLLGGLFALLVRTELLTPQRTIMDAQTYNQMFTLHGAVMIFLFIIPGIPAVIGNFVLPLMLGAKDVAFPRLNLASWWLYVVGSLFALASILIGAVDTGWTFYTPYSTETSTAVVPMTMGAFILGFSSVFTGLNFIVTIHKLRPAGMGWFRMPLLLWALYATAIIQVLATPVLGITLILLIVERVVGVGIFDPALGGDPVLYQHFFWFYSHPAVYIMILPAMGVVSEVISVFSRKHIFGYSFIAGSSIAIAFLSFLVWGHHMFTSGQSPLANTIFSALTFSVAIPSAVKVFNWLATMFRGNIVLKTPMLWILGFIFLFGIGGLTGLFLGALATVIHVHDTYFVVSHFHYTMFGGPVMALMGALFFWWPKFFGRMYVEFWGKVSAVVVFIGFNVTFFPQFILGLRGMPRRYYNYPPEFESLHVLSTLGGYFLSIGFLIAFFTLVHAIFRGKKAAANPFGAATMEWQTSSPPPLHNFVEAPHVGDPYDLAGLVYDEASDGFRPAAKEGSS